MSAARTYAATRLRKLVSRNPQATPIGRLVRAFAILMPVVLVIAAAYLVGGAVRDFMGTIRKTPRFDPPVLAGQNVPGPCSSGGFYARDQQTIVLTMAAHCADAVPGGPLRDSEGRLVGTFGQPAQLSDCPTDRLCAPADMITLVPTPDRIPWGHLNLVDMGADGYRPITPDMRPLTCADIRMGDPVEVNARDHYRTGTVIAIGPYEHETDWIFPCLVVTDIGGGHGDSGSPFFINGLPAGTTSRLMGGYLAFTPLAEGLANLGLVLCTSPDCDVSPNSVNSSSEFAHEFED